MDEGQKNTEELTALRSSAQRWGASREDRLLARGLSELYPEARGPADVEDGWAAIEGAALGIARKRRRSYHLRELLAGVGLRSRPLLAFSALAAALLLLVLLRGRWPATPATPSAQAMLVTTAQAALATTAAAPRREVRLLDGAEVALADGAAAIDQADQAQTRIVLRSGVVRVKVPHLSHRGRLVVSTTDAEVIVHGTRFYVRKVDPDTTLVAVLEGLVEVRPAGGKRSPAFLRPGESLVVHSEAFYFGQISRQVSDLIAAARCDDPDGSLDTFLSAAPARPEKIDVSAALYLKGYCAVQRSALEEAVGYFERVASTSAESIRADNAMARAAQLLASQSPAQGATAWKRYLKRFPAGLHHGSARRFLATYEPPPGP